MSAVDDDPDSILALDAGVKSTNLHKIQKEYDKINSMSEATLNATCPRIAGHRTPKQCRKRYLGLLKCLLERFENTVEYGGIDFANDIADIQADMNVVLNAGLAGSLDVTFPKGTPTERTPKRLAAREDHNEGRKSRPRRL